MIADRRDDNEAEIVKALRQVGASVYHLRGKGIPDLLVGWCGRTHLLEVKRPKVGRLTAAQKKFRAGWKGVMPALVKNCDEALVAIGAIAA